MKRPVCDIYLSKATFRVVRHDFRRGVQYRHFWVKGGNRDDRWQNCTREFRRTNGCGLDHMRLRFGSNQINSGRPWRARWSGAGTALKGLSADETAFFQDGLARFMDIEVVTKGSNNGLGPRFNSNQCFSCHSQPNAGGSSPAQNPLLAVAHLNGAKNTVPWFIVQNGPIREARFKKSNGSADGEEIG